MSNDTRPATIAEMRRAFPDDPEFAMDALERGWSMSKATSAIDARRQSAELDDPQSPGGGKGVKAIASGSRIITQQESRHDGDPIAALNAAVIEQMQKPGYQLDRKKAIAVVIRQDPELHRAYLEATNRGRDRRRLIAEKFEHDET